MRLAGSLRIDHLVKFLKTFLSGKGGAPEQTVDLAPRQIVEEAEPAAEKASPPSEVLEVIKKDFASGKHSRVSLVRGPDQTLWVWKRPNDDSKSHQMSFRKEIARSKIRRELGLSNVEVGWHEDKHSLLGTYVPGVMALDRIQDRNFWTEETYARERLALAQLIVHAAKQRAYVGDLNPKNIIFDGKRWQVIDSGSIRFKESPESTLQEYREKLMQQWSSRMHPAERKFLRHFLQALTLQNQP